MFSPEPERSNPTSLATTSAVDADRRPSMTMPYARFVAIVGMLLAVTLAQPGAVAWATNLDGAASGEAALSEAEAAIVGRMTAEAAGSDVAALVAGVAGPTKRRLGARMLLRMRGDAGALVGNACLTWVGRKGRIPIDGGLGDPRATACTDKTTRDVVEGDPSGGVWRDVRAVAGRQRLLLAVPVMGPTGRLVGVLSADVDLAGLLRAALGPLTDGAAMIVDLEGSDVVASAGAALVGADQDMAMLGSVVPLWPLADGRRLGLMELSPRAANSAPPPAPVRSGPSEIGMLVGIVLLIVVLGTTSYAIGRSNRSAGSRARVMALYREASHDEALDSLTKLPTRAGFDAAMTGRMAAYLEFGDAFALATLDIDDMSTVNEREGRSAGDEVLVVVAGYLREMVRPEDEVFRLGSDEFAVLMPGRSLHSAVADMERILHFSRRPEPGLRPASFSGGVSGVPETATDGDIVLQQAEAAVAWVKRHGRGSIEAYDAERDHVPDQPHDIASLAVREVVAGRLLSPVFQPIVDLRTGRVLGFEGLIRPDPGGPLRDANHLFAAASASGRTVELDLACIEVVLAGARAIGSDRLLTLNLSPRTLEVRDFDASWLLDLLLHNGISPSRVIVELTERDAVGDLPRLQEALRHLQGHGLRLAADDVGAGNAGLRLLSQVPFDIFKIDLSLVQDGVHQPGSRAVLESLRDLAVSQNARIVAEGVETAEQLQVVRDLDFGAGQGFLLGRPGISVEATFVDVSHLAQGIQPLSDTALVARVAATTVSGAAAMARRPLRWGLGTPAAARR